MDTKSRVILWCRASRATGTAERAVALETLDEVLERGILPHVPLLAGEQREEIPCTSIPGKLFEYIGARRPVFAMLPPGPAADIVRDTGVGDVFRPEDTEGMARALQRLFHRWSDGNLGRVGEPAAIRRYSCREITAQLAQILERVSSPPPSAGAGQGASLVN
jgi:glycosyltransferase involved in cell wall biosynthesis